MTCPPHRFLVDSVTPGCVMVTGRCACGETRQYPAFSPVDLFSPGTAMSAAKREAAMLSLGKPGSPTEVYS